MRLLRRASLLLALSLLTSATTAHAECAWVLWLTRAGFDTEGREVVEAPSVYASYAAIGDCARELDQTERMLRADRANAVTRVAPSSLDVIVRELKTLKTLRGQTWRCLPDTVDPRGVKGR
jgi:hypothetical protein